MKKTLRYVSLLAIMMVAGVVSSWAQSGTFTGNLEQQFKTDYSTDPIEFPIDELASFFGVSEATFAADLTEFIEADKAAYKTDDNSDKKLWIMQSVNGGESVFPNADLGYTANLGDYMCGFWMDETGKPQGYGDGAAWYWLVQLNAAQDTVQFLMGQMPNYWEAGGQASASLQLNYNSKTAFITLNVKFLAKPVADLPEPVTELSKLNIVKDYELVLPFEIGKSYEGKTYSAEFEGIYEALGVTSATFDEFVNDYVYTQVVKGDTTKLDPENPETWSVKYSFEDDQLVRPEVASGGAWYGRYGNQVGDTDQIEYLAMNAPQNWASNSTTNTFYTQSITLAEGTYSIVSGQYPGVLKAGDTDFAYHYIIVGDKAARVKIVAQPYVRDTSGDPDTETYTKVGEQTIKISHEKTVGGDYGQENFDVKDGDVITALLGEESIDEISLWILGAGTEMVNQPDGDHGGQWMTQEGRKSNWGASTSAFFVGKSAADGNAVGGSPYELFMLQMPGSTLIQEGETYNFPIFLVSQTNGLYYQLNIEYTVAAPQAEPDETTCVATAELTMYIVPSATTYPYDKESTIDLDWIASKIGSDKFTICTDKWNATAEKLEMNSNKTLSDASIQGFWFGTTTYEDKENREVVDNAGWGTNSFGMGFESGGRVTWWQYPGQRAVGDHFNANIYMLNKENGKYVQYYINVFYVETPPVEYEKVGEEDVIVVLTDDHLNDDGWFADNDLASAFEALDMDASEYDSGEWYAQTGSGVNQKIEVFEGSNCQFDGSGRYTTNADDFIFAVAYDASKKYFYVADVTTEWTDETLYTTKVGFANPGAETPGIYVFNVNICGSEAKAEEVLGIAGLSAAQRMNTNVYDLSGRIVRRGASLEGLQRGTYLINNKKVIIK